MKTEDQKVIEDLYNRDNRWDYPDTKVSIKKEVEHPDARLHRVVSFIKSLVRIGGYITLLFNIPLAVIILVASELIGIVEELV